MAARHRANPAGAVPQSHEELTFNKDIAPLIFTHCSECHRPGQPAPFALLTYADVKKHAADIADVTARRFMPPWLPDHPGQFVDERRLSHAEIATIARWVAQGTVEGRAADLPPLPRWSSDWQLGPPDLIVTMPESYTLPAAGKDVYRNFLLPSGLARSRYIRAMELRPGSRAVHHGFVRFDRTGQCRLQDEKDPGPGFGGMETPPTAETPPGHFCGWVPGARPMRSPRGLAWELPAQADFVLLLHMQPSGKPEQVSPALGLYFTDEPPTNTPAVINLQSFAIDIPAGATNHVVEASMTLPADVDILAVKPHAHYVGRQLQGMAILPGGTAKTLLDIPAWDFNWQTDYRYLAPVSVPAGTVLRLRYTYDNSTNNARNPHHPPQRVKYGLQSSDEMAELAFQLLPRQKQDLPKLQAAIRDYQVNAAFESSLARLRYNPDDADAAADAGKFAFARGDMARAESFLRRSIELQPGVSDVRYSLGVLLLNTGRPADAEYEFLHALRVDPRHFKARNNAGLACLRQGKLDQAEAHFREVLRFRPEDTVAQGNLNLVLDAKRAGQSR